MATISQWVEGARPRTLPAALAPVAVGTGSAAGLGHWDAALALLALRLVARRAVDPILRRLGTWLDRNADDILGWVLGIVGFLLAADAAQRLGLLQFG